MWEYLQEMATDRLWIYTAIAGSLLGAHFILKKGTHLGI